MGLTRRSLLYIGATSLIQVTHEALAKSQTPLAAPASKDPNAQLMSGKTAMAFRDANGSRRWGFIDGAGAIIIPPKFKHAADFIDGLARVEVDSNVGFVDLQGRIQVALPKGSQAVPAGADRIWKEVRVTWRNQWGWHDHWELLDFKGRRIVPPTYSDVRPFSEGLAAVNVGARKMLAGKMGGYWGFIDASGSIAVPIEYDEVRDFSEGLARVVDGKATRYVDRTGAIIVDLGELASTYAGDFREGLAPVVDHTVGRGPRTRFIDRLGRTILLVDGSAREFHDGLSLVVHGGLGEAHVYGYVDRQGRPAFSSYFDDAGPFSQGLAPATPKRPPGERGDRLWGYIDRSGSFRIPPSFNEARPFLGGFAKVHVGGTWVTVSDAPSYWQGGEWWLIDARGKKVARCD